MVTYLIVQKNLNKLKIKVPELKQKQFKPSICYLFEMLFRGKKHFIYSLQLMEYSLQLSCS